MSSSFHNNTHFLFLAKLKIVARISKMKNYLLKIALSLAVFEIIDISVSGKIQHGGRNLEN